MKAYPYLLTGALLAALSACHKNNDNASPQPASLSTATLVPTTTAIRVAGLPAPYATMAATNYPQMLMDRPAGTPLNVPAGYSVNIFQDNVPEGRWLAVAPNGDVFVAQMSKNQIMVLHDADQNGTADATSVWAMGGDLDKPEGMAFNGNYLYVACSGAILRYDYKSGQTVASGVPTKWPSCRVAASTLPVRCSLPIIKCTSAWARR